ncbi:type II toxin-antitoxin system MqsA family antitoxin [Candidatus Pantoea soli]|uniref:XRE family transcriptional regulator n=1 Tax=Candidatus Pantoea soli TaxID=3098669 RepID=A0A518XIX9_9GAMM|nr:type II toxin-antitoxin system MqsA family antitoxin [Pantoea soli]QDY44142.1 XRE family transcriptional regulator [Pantoea soli]
MKCPECGNEGFVYGKRDVELETGDVVPAVQGSHCLTCGEVLLNLADADAMLERLDKLE